MLFWWFIFFLHIQDGRTYVHCDKCARCVKPSWTHCKECKRCCLPDHTCGDFKPTGCFLCHKPDHKKSECPIRNNAEVSLKNLMNLPKNIPSFLAHKNFFLAREKAPIERGSKRKIVLNLLVVKKVTSTEPNILEKEKNQSI